MNENERKIDHLSDKEILASLYGSQAAMLLIGLTGAYFVFDDLSMFLQLLSFTWYETIVIGGSFALIVVGVDLLMYRVIPYRHLDDGGINERVFKGRSVLHMIILCMVIAVVEELLFRAVLQTAFGLIAASIIFALVHVRYLKKPILFSFVLLVSFSLGLLFEYTNNLTVTIFAHFLIDFLFGLFLRKKSRK
ncbi:CPBP family intramembrane metalloprotease [Alkalihalophilus marmarensis]|jgi:membrane protease YdiL (CAAX protease family)|uniref:Membrane protein n=1 Tax=Alkalihalophilus marmarensis DSM 21297 TaxID=1188261 RepID=U6SQY8_9BACI|nr:CPBP family intramembrane glutamic endopeptidase [Alkalihalophilus marmarensis]ERN54134.1 membrane protein [Alkalihalophilus marmarensis DSM 21297]MCM3488443.1 CPBP family intramembrane metalloprotease [Alkalihalophilus marmarensis]